MKSSTSELSLRSWKFYDFNFIDVDVVDVVLYTAREGNSFVFPRDSIDIKCFVI
jgi:hypothetical protein